jgi:hypothetical protein
VSEKTVTQEQVGLVTARMGRWNSAVGLLRWEISCV